MARFIIHGGRRLTGDFVPSGNKNAALPMLAACLLTDEEVCISRLPLIDDVRVMLEILEDLGVSVNLCGRTACLRAGGIRKCAVDSRLGGKVRSSILLAGPLMARHGHAVLPPPGGDVIGRRRLDSHFLALSALGAEITGSSTFTFRRRRLRGADILLDEASVTATENALMAAVLAPGKTVLFNAACEPHVVDLGRLLVRMGAQIEGIGTNRIVVRGVRRLRGARLAVGSDYIEAGSFLAAAAATRGSIRLPRLSAGTWLPVIDRAFRRLGIRLRLGHRELALEGVSRPTVVQPDQGDCIPTLSDGVWPAFPSDLMSVAIVLATQCRGSLLFFEKLFESRMYFVDPLIRMGARIVPCDPHRVLVSGPSRLQGDFLSTPDIRAGMAMIVAALCARGRSVIENAQVIDRGYERVDERLRALGADIEREE